MSLGLKKHHLDFEILDVDNPKTLVFLDTSEYMEQPERPLLELTLPGHSRYFLLNVVARKVNTFNSNTIGLSEVFDTHCLQELPDGVYTAKYKICPYDKIWVQKHFLRTTLFDRSLDKAFTYINLDSEREKKEVIDIMLLKEAAKANVKEGLIKKGIEQFKEANEALASFLRRLKEFC